MTVKWQRIDFLCAKCKGETKLQGAAYSADGELRFEAFCNNCKQEVHWRVFACVLQQKAMYNDIDKDKEESKNTTPLLSAPISVDLAEGDSNILHDLGIKEEQKKNKKK